MAAFSLHADLRITYFYAVVLRFRDRYYEGQ